MEGIREEANSSLFHSPFLPSHDPHLVISSDQERRRKKRTKKGDIPQIDLLNKNSFCHVVSFPPPYCHHRYRGITAKRLRLRQKNDHMIKGHERGNRTLLLLWERKMILHYEMPRGEIDTHQLMLQTTASVCGRHAPYLSCGRGKRRNSK